MLYTAKQVAAILGMTARNVTQWYCRKYNIGRRLGHQWLLTRTDISIIAAKQRGRKEALDDVSDTA